MTLFVLTNMVVRNMHDLQSNLTRTVLVQQALDQESGQLSSNFNLLLMTTKSLAVLFTSRRAKLYPCGH